MSDAVHHEVSRRNGRAVEEALRRMDVALCEQEIRINGLNATISTLCNRINALEQMVAIQKAKSMGHGPTAA